MNMKLHGKYLISSFIIVASCLQQCCWGQSTTVRPYKFGFTIDEQQHRSEQRDERGIVMGEFGFITADGIYHVTVYATDEQGRFRILAMRNYPYESPPKTVEVMVQPKIPPKTTTTTTTTTPKALTRHNFNTEACSGCFLVNGNNKPKDPNNVQEKPLKNDIRPLSKALPSSGSNSASSPKLPNNDPTTANKDFDALKTPVTNQQIFNAPFALAPEKIVTSSPTHSTDTFFTSVLKDVPLEIQKPLSKNIPLTHKPHNKHVDQKEEAHSITESSLGTHSLTDKPNSVVYNDLNSLNAKSIQFLKLDLQKQMHDMTPENALIDKRPKNTLEMLTPSYTLQNPASKNSLKSVEKIDGALQGKTLPKKSQSAEVINLNGNVASQSPTAPNTLNKQYTTNYSPESTTYSLQANVANQPSIIPNSIKTQYNTLNVLTKPREGVDSKSLLEEAVDRKVDSISQELKYPNKSYTVPNTLNKQYTTSYSPESQTPSLNKNIANQAFIIPTNTQNMLETPTQDNILQNINSKNLFEEPVNRNSDSISQEKGKFKNFNENLENQSSTVPTALNKQYTTNYSPKSPTYSINENIASQPNTTSNINKQYTANNSLKPPTYVADKSPTTSNTLNEQNKTKNSPASQTPFINENVAIQPFTTPTTVNQYSAQTLLKSPTQGNTLQNIDSKNLLERPVERNPDSSTPEKFSFKPQLLAETVNFNASLENPSPTIPNALNTQQTATNMLESSKQSNTLEVPVERKIGSKLEVKPLSKTFKLAEASTMSENVANQPSTIINTLNKQYSTKNSPESPTQFLSKNIATKQYTNTNILNTQYTPNLQANKPKQKSPNSATAKTAIGSLPPIMDIIMQKVLPTLMAKKPQTPSSTTTLNKPNAVPSGNKPSTASSAIDNSRKSSEGLSPSSAVNGDGDLYRFKYILDYHGHTETGKRNGNKEGSYYAIGDDGVERTIEYVANEFGYQPRIRWRKLNSDEIKSKENTLKDYEFIWFK